MKTKERKEKHVQYRGDNRDLMRNYTMEMQAARRSPRIYYSKDGRLKSIK